MRRVFLAVVVLAACSSSTGTSTTQASADLCEEPPAAEIETASTLDMTVDPNPATAQETVGLRVSSSGLPDDALVGIDARWQCWDGSDWVTTHLVYRGFGDNAGQTIALNSEFQINVPSIGLELDEAFPIVIPEVQPGLYRIADEVFVDEKPTPGFVIIEVRGG